MRTLRTTIVILLFLSLLALSLVGALTLYATPERVTARAAAMLESHLGLRAELSGDVELKRLPKLILRIPAGELIHTKDSTHAGRFASAEIELAPWSLFAQSPRVDRVSVDRLELNDISYAKLLENTTSSAEHAVWNIDQLELTQASIRFDALPHVGAGMLSALDAEFSNLSETGGTVRLAGTLTLPQAPSISAAPVSEGSAQTLNGLTGTLTFTGVFTFDAQKGLVLQMPAATFDGISGSMNFKASASASRLTSAPMGQPWIAEKPSLGGSLRESTTFSIQAPTASITSDGIFAEYASARGQLSAAKRNWSLAGTAGVDLSWANGSLKLSALDLSSSTDSTTVNRLTGTLNLSADTLQTNLEGTFLAQLSACISLSCPAMPYRATSHWERHPRPRLRAFLLSGDILSQQTDETSKSPLRLAPSNYPKQESSLLLTMCRRISLVPQASSISPAAKPLFLTAQYSLPAFSRRTVFGVSTAL